MEVNLGDTSETESSLGTTWKIDQEEALKVTFKFIVWVHYNGNNKPLNSKKNVGGAVGCMEKIMSSTFNSGIFLHYASIILLKYIHNSN